MEDKALIVIEKIDPVKVFTEGDWSPVLAEIRTKATAFDADISTSKGRDEIKSMAYKVARSKTLLDDLGKSLVSDMKAKVKAVDESRKKIRDTLDALKDEVRQPLSEWEAEQEKIKEEEARQAKEKADKRFAELFQFPPVTLSYLDVAAMDDETYISTLQAAKAAWEAEQARIKTEEEARKAEAERLEAERKKQEEEAVKLRAEREAMEAEKRKLEEERRAMEEAKRAEQERKDREAFEKQAQENARIAAEKEAAERAEREAREAKECAEREAKEKEERERQETEEKARQERLRPDKEKLISWVESFNDRNIPGVTLQTKEAKEVYNSAKEDIEIVLQGVLKKAEAL